MGSKKRRDGWVAGKNMANRPGSRVAFIRQESTGPGGPTMRRSSAHLANDISISHHPRGLRRVPSTDQSLASFPPSCLSLCQPFRPISQSVLRHREQWLWSSPFVLSSTPTDTQPSGENLLLESASHLVSGKGTKKTTLSATATCLSLRYRRPPHQHLLTPFARFTLPARVANRFFSLASLAASSLAASSLLAF